MYLQSIFVKCNIFEATTLNGSKNVESYSNITILGQSCRWNYKIFFNQGECIYDDRHLLYINSEASMVNESTYVQDYSNIIIHWNNKIFFKHGDSLWQKFVKSNHSWAIPKIDLETFLQRLPFSFPLLSQAFGWSVLGEGGRMPKVFWRKWYMIPLLPSQHDLWNANVALD